jgi:hypothetical protein
MTEPQILRLFPRPATEIAAMSAKELATLAESENEEAIKEIDRRAFNKKVKRLLAKRGTPEAA